MSNSRPALCFIVLLMASACTASQGPSGGAGSGGGGSGGGRSGGEGGQGGSPSGSGGSGGGCGTQPPPGTFEPCFQPLEKAAHCARTWPGARTPICTWDHSRVFYEGPNAGYLVKEMNDGTSSSICVYDQTTLALVAAYVFTDVRTLCCNSAHSVWYGPKIDGLTPAMTLCRDQRDAALH